MNKILVICPEPSLRLFYAAELTEEGFEVVTAGREPIAGLIAVEQPDLIVWDRESKDEKNLLKAIGNVPENLPVIFGLDRVPLTSGLKQHLRVDYFIKGSDLEELKIRIKRLLRPQKFPVIELETLYSFSAAPVSQLNLDFLPK